MGVDDLAARRSEATRIPARAPRSALVATMASSAAREVGRPLAPARCAARGATGAGADSAATRYRERDRRPGARAATRDRMYSRAGAVTAEELLAGGSSTCLPAWPSSPVPRVTTLWPLCQPDDPRRRAAPRRRPPTAARASIGRSVPISETTASARRGGHNRTPGVIRARSRRFAAIPRRRLRPSASPRERAAIGLEAALAMRRLLPIEQLVARASPPRMSLPLAGDRLPARCRCAHRGSGSSRGAARDDLGSGGCGRVEVDGREHRAAPRCVARTAGRRVRVRSVLQPEAARRRLTAVTPRRGAQSGVAHPKLRPAVAGAHCSTRSRCDRVRDGERADAARRRGACAARLTSDAAGGGRLAAPLGAAVERRAPACCLYRSLEQTWPSRASGGSWRRASTRRGGSPSRTCAACSSRASTRREHLGARALHGGGPSAERPADEVIELALRGPAEHRREVGRDRGPSRARRDSGASARRERGERAARGNGAAATTRQSTSAIACAPVSCRAARSIASRTGVAPSSVARSHGSSRRAGRARATSCPRSSAAGVQDRERARADLRGVEDRRGARGRARRRHHGDRPAQVGPQRDPERLAARDVGARRRRVRRAGGRARATGATSLRRARLLQRREQRRDVAGRERDLARERAPVAIRRRRGLEVEEAVRARLHPEADVGDVAHAGAARRGRRRAPQRPAGAAWRRRGRAPRARRRERVERHRRLDVAAGPALPRDPDREQRVDARGEAPAARERSRSAHPPRARASSRAAAPPSASVSIARGRTSADDAARGRARSPRGARTRSACRERPLAPRGARLRRGCKRLVAEERRVREDEVRCAASAAASASPARTSARAPSSASRPRSARAASGRDVEPEQREAGRRRGRRGSLGRGEQSPAAAGGVEHPAARRARRRAPGVGAPRPSSAATDAATSTAGSRAAAACARPNAARIAASASPREHRAVRARRARARRSPRGAGRRAGPASGGARRPIAKRRERPAARREAAPAPRRAASSGARPASARERARLGGRSRRRPSGTRGHCWSRSGSGRHLRRPPVAPPQQPSAGDDGEHRHRDARARAGSPRRRGCGPGHRCAARVDEPRRGSEQREPRGGPLERGQAPTHTSRPSATSCRTAAALA